MNCSFCGKENNEGIKFCEKCKSYLSPNIERGKDRKYRWIYELNLYKNFTVLYTVWLVLGISFGLVLIVAFIASKSVKVLIIFALLFVAIVIISIIAYLLYAAFHGGKYVILFEMGPKEVVHIVAPKDFSKDKKLATGMGVVGALTGNLSLIGQSLYQSNAKSMTSVYKSVSKVKSVRRRNVIYVSETLNKNQIYVPSEDFDFVDEFIRSHVEEAKNQSKNKAKQNNK